MTPQELHYLSQAFFFLMLAGFGFSWPFSIIRTYKAGHSGKGVAGKSPMFMIIILVGYVCGIASKLVCPIPEGLTWLQDKWLVLVYLIDMSLVSTDLGLYCHYTRKMRSGVYDAENALRALRGSLLADGRIDAAEAELLRRVAQVFSEKGDEKSKAFSAELENILADGKVTQEESDHLAALLAKV